MKHLRLLVPLLALLGLLAATPAGAQAPPAAASTSAAEQLATSAQLRAARAAERIARTAQRRVKRTIGIARGARRLGNRALRVARQARRIGREARSAAAAAAATANQAGARLDRLAIVSSTEAGSVATASEEDFVALGGPSVRATVPASGMVEVWATVTFDDPSDGLVALYEDGNRVELGDQARFCGSEAIGQDVLLMAQLGPGTPVTLSTPPSPDFGLTCGVAGSAGAPVLLSDREPGEHTYELRYADCGCFGVDASFSQRTLRVAPRP